VYFGRAVVFPEGVPGARVDYFSLVWVAVSFLAMYRFKIGMIPWIGISAGAGLLYFLIRL
jgi:chromate transporter